jgi:S1-C subfamily serine protease
MSTETLARFSDELADLLADAAPFTVAIRTGRRDRSGILWRDDVVVASEQVLPEGPDFTVVRNGAEIPARLAGRDPGTNVAVLRLTQGLGGRPPEVAATARPGSLVLLAGADSAGAPTGRLGMVHATGPAWHSMAGGRIDALLHLDARLGSDEGGPVLTVDGRLLGMSTSGPRRRALVIPASTVARVLDPLLSDGQIARGWLGVGLQAVQVPERMRDAAGRDRGMMVLRLAPGAPAEQAGVLPGDIILEVDGRRTGRAAGGLASVRNPDRIGQPATLKLLRAGEVHLLTVLIGAQPTRT